MVNTKRCGMTAGSDSLSYFRSGQDTGQLGWSWLWPETTLLLAGMALHRTSGRWWFSDGRQSVPVCQLQHCGRSAPGEATFARPMAASEGSKAGQRIFHRSLADPRSLSPSENQVSEIVPEVPGKVSPQ